MTTTMTTASGVFFPRPDGGSLPSFRRRDCSSCSCSASCRRRVSLPRLVVRSAFRRLRPSFFSSCSCSCSAPSSHPDRRRHFLAFPPPTPAFPQADGRRSWSSTPVGWCPSPFPSASSSSSRLLQSSTKVPYGPSRRRARWAAATARPLPPPPTRIR